MKNKQKGFIIPVLIVVIALLIIGGGTYIYQNNKSEKVVDLPSVSPAPNLETNKQSSANPQVTTKVTSQTSVATRDISYEGILFNSPWGKPSNTQTYNTDPSTKTVNYSFSNGNMIALAVSEFSPSVIFKDQPTIQKYFNSLGGTFTYSQYMSFINEVNQGKTTFNGTIIPKKELEDAKEAFSIAMVFYGQLPKLETVNGNEIIVYKEDSQMAVFSVIKGSKIYNFNLGQSLGAFDTSKIKQSIIFK